MAKLSKAFWGFLLMIASLNLFAEAAPDRRVALIPFWGDYDDIVAQFGEELYSALNETMFRPERVDMQRLPPSIPPGGLPPYMNPGPMLFGETPFAITGQVLSDPASELWRLRLYLWQVPQDRLLLTDELVAPDRESVNMILPFMLRWLFSRVPEETPREPSPPPPPPDPPPISPSPESSLLYVGLQVTGNMQMFAPIWGTEGGETHVDNAGMAVSLNFQLLNFRLDDFRPFDFEASYVAPRFFLGLQLEGAVTYDFGNDALFMTFPALLRFTARGESSFLALLGGGYALLPLPSSGERVRFGHADEGFLWGYTAGLLWGRRFGPGYVNAGLRWSGDMFSTIRTDTWGYFHNRRVITVSIGYELGVLRAR